MLEYDVEKIKTAIPDNRFIVAYSLHRKWRGAIKFEGKNLEFIEEMGEEPPFFILIDETMNSEKFEQLMKLLIQDSKVIKFIDSNFSQSQKDIIAELMRSRREPSIYAPECKKIELYSTTKFYNPEVVNFFQSLTNFQDKSAEPAFKTDVTIVFLNENIIEDNSIVPLIQNCLTSFEKSDQTESITIGVYGQDKKIIKNVFVDNACQESGKKLKVRKHNPGYNLVFEQYYLNLVKDSMERVYKAFSTVPSLQSIICDQHFNCVSVSEIREGLKTYQNMINEKIIAKQGNQR